MEGNVEIITQQKTRKLKTHCIQGHSYSGKNLIIEKNGRRDCRTCHNKWSRENYQRNKAKRKIRQKEYYKSHPEFREKNKLRINKLRRDHPEIIQNRILKSRYGITKTKYDELYKNQFGRCLICGSQNKGKSLHIDHDHFSSKVRGLLCNLCNVGLGSFKDNPKLLRIAANYLEQSVFIK